MNIIAITLSTSGDKIGGAYIASELHTINIKKLGVNIELWRMWSFDSEQIKDGLKVRSFESKSVFKLFSKFLPKRFISIFLYSEISKELIRKKPDIVHIHNILPPFELLRICKICKKNNIKTLITTHGFYECFNPSFNFNFLERYLWKWVVTNPVNKSLPLFDAFMSLYPLEANLLKSKNIPNSKIHLVPNGVDSFYEEKPSNKEINCVINKYNIDKSDPILFFTGNHTANKGLDIIRELYKNLNIKSTIIIGGRLSNKNEPKSFLKGIYSKNVRVVFTDFLPIIDQRAFYHLSTLLLFPSRSDTLPLTIIESMACGLPVIAFNVGGINFLLKNNTGYLINPNDVDAFCKKVKNILENKQDLKIKSIKAKERQNKVFSWPKAANKSIKIYENL